MAKKASKAAKVAANEKAVQDAKLMEAAKQIAADNEAKEAAAADERRVAEASKHAELIEKYAALGLSENDIIEYKEMFDLVDSDHGGSIGRDEVLDLMKTVGYDCTEEEVDDMISEIDIDGNGDIDFDEFITMMSKKPEALRHPDEIKGAFKLFEQQIDVRRLPPCQRRHRVARPPVVRNTSLTNEGSRAGLARDGALQFPDPRID
jgi:hypothetical protein